MSRMYRNWMFINCASLLFIAMACKTIEPSLPELSIQNRAQIEPEVSRLNIDIEVNMKGMFAEAEKSTPLSFEGSSSSCEGVSYTYAFSRKPLTFSTLPTQLETKIEGGFSLNLSYCPLCITLWNGKESCTVPRIYASCGVNEKKRGYSMRYLTTLGLSNDYKLTAKTKLEEFKIKDPCELTFLNYDVTERVEKEIEKELKVMQAKMDEDIASIEVKSKIENAWKELQKSIPIEPYGFLQLNPSSFSTTDLRYEDETAKFTLSLFFSPEITTDNHSKPYEELKEMIPNERLEGFSILTDVASSYDTLSSILTNEFKDEVISIKGKEIVVRNLKVIGCQSDRLVLCLEFDGFRKGRVYMVCRPVVDAKMQLLTLEDIDFEIKTKAFLLKSAEWLLGNRIRNAIEKKAKIDMSESLNSLLKTIEDRLNQPLASGVNVHSKLNELRINSLVLGKTHLYIRTQMNGEVKIVIESDEYR